MSTDNFSDCKVNGHTYKKIEKQLLFVRHAEGFHNSLFDEKRVHEAVNIRDPELTPLGNCQVADLRKEVPNFLCLTLYALKSLSI